MKIALRVILLLTSFVATEGRAQEAMAPTLEETLNWIETKVNTSSGMSYQIVSSSPSKEISGSGQQKYSISFDSKQCGLTLKETSIQTLKVHGSPTENYLVYQTLLADFSRVEVRPLGDSSDETFGPGGWLPTGWVFYDVQLSSDENVVVRSSSSVYKGERKEQPDEIMVSFIGIPFRTKDIAERVAKAFTRAIELCKQKEPY